jgi:hypothetical protein
MSPPLVALDIDIDPDGDNAIYVIANASTSLVRFIDVNALYIGVS